MFILLQDELVLAKEYCLKILPFLSTQVVQRLDKAMHWINHYLANIGYENELSYLVDSGLSSGYCSSLFQQPGPSAFNNYYSNVQSRPRFCVTDGKYSILAQNEMIMESY